MITLTSIRTLILGVCLQLGSVSALAQDIKINPGVGGQVKAEPKWPNPTNTLMVNGPAFGDDNEVVDLSLLSGRKVYVGVLGNWQPLVGKDKPLEDGILDQVIKVSSGLKSAHLEIRADGAITYKKYPVQVRFYWYEFNRDKQLLKSGAFSEQEQATLFGRFKRNLEISIQRTTFVPPTFEQLGVPPIRRESFGAEVVRETVPLGSVTAGLKHLTASIEAISQVDPKLAERLRRTIQTGKAMRIKRLSLVGNSSPTVIYQIVNYTPAAVMIADDSFDRLGDDHKSNAMLYVLLTAILPDTQTVRARAWQFHLEIAALIRNGAIDPIAYEEAKRRFALSPRTEDFFRLVDDFETYLANAKDKYNLGANDSKMVLAQLKSLQQILRLDAYVELAKDYQKLYGESPKPLPDGVETDAIIRFKIQVSDLIDKGEIVGSDLEQWLAEKEREKERVRALKLSQPQQPPSVAPRVPGP